MKLLAVYLTTLLMMSLVAFSSCNKDTEPEIVPATTTGANTMGFYVDGKLCNITGKGTFLSPEGVELFINANNHLEISSTTGGECGIKYLSIVLDRDMQNVSHLYELSSERKSSKGYISDNSGLGGLVYTTDSIHVGHVKFHRYDEDIISGTFEFDAINTESGKVISVTDGRFDIRWE